MKKFCIAILISFIVSCSNLEFVYGDKENVSNPIYQKTKVVLSGADLPYLKSYVPVLFGKNISSDFYLLIRTEEKQTKRSVETNQATSSLSYELRFFYSLESNDLKCVVYKQEILSTFSINPKSSGYNYGTDTSLDKKYELSVSNNLDRFVSNISNKNLNVCI